MGARTNPTIRASNESRRPVGVALLPRHLTAFQKMGVEPLGLIILGEGSEHISPEIFERFQAHFDGELEIFPFTRESGSTRRPGVRITFPLHIKAGVLCAMLAAIGWPTEKINATPELLENTVKAELGHSLKAS